MELTKKGFSTPHIEYNSNAKRKVVNIVEFNSRDVFDKSGPNGNGENRILRGILNTYEITENLEEYYRQKAPNLWNAWIRTNNMLVEMNERYDKQVMKINYLYKTIDGISEQLDRIENILSKNQE